MKEEHENMSNPKFGGITFMCPVIGKQICMWCCLHISDIADPMKREKAYINHTKYAEIATKISGRDLDDIFRTCSRCRNR
jgi:hypothetical protein